MIHVAHQLLRPFRIAGNVNVATLREELDANPDLWGQQSERRYGPHTQMVDIWPRYRDVEAYRAQHGTDMRHFCDEHESIWLSPSEKLPSVKLIAEQVMKEVGATILGGVLITKVEPQGSIARHVDGGWHAGFYDKYYVAVKNPDGSRFCWDEGEIAAKDGEVWWFRNDVPHWVENPTKGDRIAMILCMK